MLLVTRTGIVSTSFINLLSEVYLEFCQSLQWDYSYYPIFPDEKGVLQSIPCYFQQFFHDKKELIRSDKRLIKLVKSLVL